VRLTNGRAAERFRQFRPGAGLGLGKSRLLEQRWRGSSTRVGAFGIGRSPHPRISIGLSGRGRWLYCPHLPRRRGGRVAEGARLESVYTGNRIVGSNPTPSAIDPSGPRSPPPLMPPFSACPEGISA